MYCQNCGKEIIIEEQNKQNNEAITINSFFRTIVAVIIILGSIISAYKIGKKEELPNTFFEKIFEKEIDNNDYRIETKEKVSSIEIIIKPNTFINYCQIKLTIYDEYNRIIYENTLTKENLSNGGSYTYEFSFGIITSLSTSNYNYKIIGAK